MNKTETRPPTAGDPSPPRRAVGGLAVIVNITDQQWVLHRTYGNFVISAAGGASAAGGYALNEVAARKATMDLGDKRTLEIPISAREVAEDLTREINSDGGDGSYFGAFVCAGERPTEEELAEARAQLEEFYKRQVYIADQEWERSHNHQFITDVQRRAARWLGIEKDWCYEPKPLVDCPACGEKLKPGVAVCKSCGAVLDQEKALRFGLVPSRRAASAVSAEAGAGGEIELGGDLVARPIAKSGTKR